jgi:peroxiredoxin
MPKQNKIVIAVLLALVLLVAAATFYIRYQRANAIPEETQRLFAGNEGGQTYTDTKGNQISLEQYLGKVLIVTTWASWSPFTTPDLTVLNEIVASYDANKIVGLGINRMEPRSQAERYMATMPEFPNVVLVIDTEDFFYKSVGGYAMPETLVFNAKGEIVEHVRGTINKEQMVALIDSILEVQN